MKGLYKSRTDKQICGVCAGIAKYFDWNVTAVRILMVALVFCADFGLLFYIVAALLMKEEPQY